MHPPGNPDLSISDKAFGPVSITENLTTLRNHGFSHLHFSHKWTHPEPLTPEELAAWQEALDTSGMKVLDVHGCHPKQLNLWSDDPDVRTKAFDLFRHRLQVTHALGGDAMVYHVPCHVEPTNEVLGWFIDGLDRAQELARELNIVVALENHYLPENDKRALSLAFETFAPEYIGFTFDPGHAMISGNFDWILDNCGPRLKILHLNDNDSTRDFHWNPFDPSGLVDWDRVARFIKASPYSKPIQLEVSWSPEHHGSHSDFLTEAKNAALRFC